MCVLLLCIFILVFSKFKCKIVYMSFFHFKLSYFCLQCFVFHIQNCVLLKRTYFWAFLPSFFCTFNLFKISPSASFLPASLCTILLLSFKAVVTLLCASCLTSDFSFLTLTSHWFGLWSCKQAKKMGSHVRRWRWEWPSGKTTVAATGRYVVCFCWDVSGHLFTSQPHCITLTIPQRLDIFLELLND